MHIKSIFRTAVVGLIGGALGLLGVQIANASPAWSTRLSTRTGASREVPILERLSRAC
jgi:hypothetical protein